MDSPLTIKQLDIYEKRVKELKKMMNNDLDNTALFHVEKELNEIIQILK